MKINQPGPEPGIPDPGFIPASSKKPGKGPGNGTGSGSRSGLYL